MSKGKRTKAKIKKKHRRKAKKYEAKIFTRDQKNAQKTRSTTTDEILRECGAYDL